MKARWIAAVALFIATVALMARETPAVFSAEQAAAGKRAYNRSCASCHMPDLRGSNDVPPLAGPLFTTTWRTRTTKDLFDYLAASMPPGGSSLSADTYESITAYILDANGASSGETMFRATTAVAIEELLDRGRSGRGAFESDNSAPSSPLPPKLFRAHRIHHRHPALRSRRHDRRAPCATFLMAAEMSIRQECVLPTVRDHPPL